MADIKIRDLDTVRINSEEEISTAAHALHEISMKAGFRAAPAHDIADKRTPVDHEGNVLASSVFGWGEDESAWWRNSRIALDSPITSACRFESEPFWVNEDGFRTKVPNRYIDGIDLKNFATRAMTPAAIVVPIHMAFGKIGAHALRQTCRCAGHLRAHFHRKLCAGDGSQAGAAARFAPFQARGRVPAMGRDRQDRS